MIYIDVPLSNGKIEKAPVYDIYDYPYTYLALHSTTCHAKKTSYIAQPAAFDIETTAINEEDNHFSFMYLWQFSLQKTVIMGRTWEEFIYFFKKLGETLGLSKNKRLVIYVHFLSFEFMFIKDFLHIEDLFAKSKRKLLKFNACILDLYNDEINKMNGNINNLPFFEFRCSFFLSNMSLAKFCENSEGCLHYKMSGDDFNYKEIRTPETKLTNNQIAYGYNDVVGLEECILYRLSYYNDTLGTIPLTSTSYVRREMRKECLKEENYRNFFLSTALSLHDYKLCRAAFRGGNTHASRYYTGIKLSNVGSYDLCSSYPAWMLIKKYPITKFYSYEPDNMADLLNNCASKAVVFSFKMINVRIKKYVPVPYIDIAHCAYTKNVVNDNGRVLSADILEYTCTDVDFRIILNQYIFDDFYYIDGIIAEKNYLPEPIRTTILKWYDKKTLLKGVRDKEYEYIKSKNDLNAIFGMMVSDIIHSNIIYDGNEWLELKLDDEKAEKSLESYYKSRNNFLPYQFGIYVTAYARDMLQRMIDSVSWRDFVYCDTDSVKLLNPSKHSESFESMNNFILNGDYPSRIYANNSKGDRVYLGVWDNEGVYDEFVTYGAKKYAFKKDEKICVTVSGLAKKEGSLELEKGRGLEDFYIGKVFKNSGRTTAYFNEESIHKITVNGDTFTTASNIGIEDTTYTLGVTNEYAEIFYKAQEKFKKSY